MSTQGRKACRSGDRCHVTTVGELIYCAVNHSDLTAEQIAEGLNVRRGYLLDAANPDRDDTQFQLRLFLPLLRLTKRWDLMETFCVMGGGVYYRLPETFDGSNLDAVQHIGQMAAEFGQVLNHASQSLVDGVVTREEAETVEEHSNKFMSRVLAFVSMFKTKAGQVGPRRVERA
jgi:hypothetical protein